MGIVSNFPGAMESQDYQVLHKTYKTSLSRFGAQCTQRMKALLQFSPTKHSKQSRVQRHQRAIAASITFKFSKLFNVFLCYQGNIIAALLGNTLNSHDQKLPFCFVCCAICSFLPELHSGKWPTRGSAAWQMSGTVAHFVYVCLCMPKFINIHRGVFLIKLNIKQCSNYLCLL